MFWGGFECLQITCAVAPQKPMRAKYETAAQRKSRVTTSKLAGGRIMVRDRYTTTASWEAVTSSAIGGRVASTHEPYRAYPTCRSWRWYTIATGKHAGALRTGSDLSANRRGAAGLFVSVDLRISATFLG